MADPLEHLPEWPSEDADSFTERLALHARAEAAEAVARFYRDQLSDVIHGAPGMEGLTLPDRIMARHDAEAARIARGESECDHDWTASSAYPGAVNCAKCGLDASAEAARIVQGGGDG